MSRPGARLRRLAARICSERTRRRLVEPAIADLQAEFAVARSTGARWRTLRTLGAGYGSIAKVFAIAAVGDLRNEASSWQPEERAGARRGVFVAIVTTVIATAAFVAMPVSGSQDWALLGLYLTPSTLAMTVPLGLMLGVARTFHGTARTRKLAAAAIVLAALCSIAMFANLGWLTPEANQAYRETRFAHQFENGNAPPLERGFFELTWSGMRARLREARATESLHEVRYLEVAYHRNLAITVAPLAMVGVILALAFRRRWGRCGLTGAAVVLAVAHVLLSMALTFFGGHVRAPTFVIGWSVTALFAAAALLITSSRSRA